MIPRKAKKLAILQTEPNLVFFDEIQSLKNKLKGIKGFLSEINTKEVKTYEEELKTLLEAISGLTDSVESKDMVVNIPLDNLTSSIERVESAIKAIKEVKIPEFPKEMSLTDNQINEILLAIQSIPEFPVSELKLMMYSLEKAIRNIKIEKEDKEFDYDFLKTKFDGLIKAIKNISITVASGGNGFPEALTSTNPHTGSREVRVYQENHICNENTTTTPLGAGEEWIGAWQDALDYQEVNVSVDTDQNSATNGLVFQWSADGVNIGDTDTFSVYANSGTNYTPNPAFRYVRMKYTNGTQAQGRFSLMTILRRGVTGGSFHRIDSTLKDDSDARLNITVPKLKTAANTYVSQTATTAGNAKMSLEELETGISVNNKTQLRTTNYTSTGVEGTKITDNYGFTVENTPMDELRVAEATRLVGTTFIGTTIDPNFWTSTLANNGTASQANNQITLGSSTTNNGSSILQTVRRARYVASISNRFRATIQLGDIGVADNTRRWGMFDGTDGAYFELAGTTLSSCIIKTGSRTAVATLSAPTTNATNYEIYVTNSKVYFVIGGVLVATHNATTATWADTINLPVRIDNINSGSTTNSTISVRVASITRLGKLETAPTYRNITGVNTSQILKYGAGMIHNIIIGTPVNNATISIYDNISGTGTPITVLTLPALATPFQIDLHVGFSTGLNIVPSSTSLNLTVVYE